MESMPPTALGGGPTGCSSGHAAEVLGLSSHALAQWIVTEHAERTPAMAERYGVVPRMAMVSETQGRLAHLCAAVDLGKPSRFATHIQWSLRAHVSRGGPPEEFVAGLACMRDVLSRELPVESFAEVEPYLRAGELAASTGSTRTRDIGTTADGPLGTLSAQYTLALLEGDRRRASRLVSDSYRMGTSLEDLYEHVFMRSQVSIGTMWHAGDVSISEEHFCTTSTLMIMSQFYERIAAGPSKDRCVLVSAVQGELHELGARMVADHFEIHGWRAVFLGQSTPATDIRDAAIDFDCDLIALSASTLVRVPDVKRTILSIRDDARTRRIPILIGGGAFESDDECALIGADAMATSARSAPAIGDRLVDRKAAR